MKQLKISCLLFRAAIVFFLTSCGGGSNEKKAEADTTSTSTATTEPGPVNTIITTPQSMVVVMHKVANYAKWKPAYDAHDSTRLPMVCIVMLSVVV